MGKKYRVRISARITFEKIFEMEPEGADLLLGGNSMSSTRVAMIEKMVMPDDLKVIGDMVIDEVEIED